MFRETDPFRWAKGKLLFACHVVSVVEIEREEFLLGRRPGVHPQPGFAWQAAWSTPAPVFTWQAS